MGYNDTHPEHRNNAPVIVSAPLPIGVTFLLNILLEMDIPIYTKHMNLFWKERKGNLILDPFARKQYVHQLPGFDTKQTSQIGVLLRSISYTSGR